MIRGIYAGASGMVAESLRTDVISNNLANANTAGYKKDIAVNKDFANILITRINDGPEAPVGSTGIGVVVDEIATSQSPGLMRNTMNDFDLAIEGQGFFVIETPQGPRYTRNGTFSKNIRGELITQNGQRVLGQNNRPIIVKGNKMVISEDGRVLVDDVLAGKVQVVDFADTRKLQKEGASLFIAPQNQRPRPATGAVRQGFLELSNVNVITEMVNLISNYRAYEINGKVIQSHDQLIGKAVNDVGKI